MKQVSHPKGNHERVIAAGNNIQQTKRKVSVGVTQKNGQDIYVSCWKPSPEDVEAINNGGLIELYIAKDKERSDFDREGSFLDMVIKAIMQNDVLENFRGMGFSVAIRTKEGEIIKTDFSPDEKDLALTEEEKEMWKSPFE